MVGKLKGIIEDIFPNFIIIDVNGVGYRVEGLMDVKKDEKVELFIYTHVREQELRLFGFKSRDSLIMFEKLLDVQGIGPKLAVKVVNLISLHDIVTAIATDDSSMLRIPGLGEKLAKKIIIDLKNKVDKDELGALPKAVGVSKDMNDVLEALLSLGFRKEGVEQVLRMIPSEGKSQQTIIKEALSLLQVKAK